MYRVTKSPDGQIISTSYGQWLASPYMWGGADRDDGPLDRAAYVRDLLGGYLRGSEKYRMVSGFANRNMHHGTDREFMDGLRRFMERFPPDNYEKPVEDP